MNSKNSFRKFPELGNLELQKATYRDHSFSPHFHEEYGIGIIIKGSQQKHYRGSKHIIRAGQICVMNPGEVHFAHPVTQEGWTYRMIYANAALFKEISADMNGRMGGYPYFPNLVIEDTCLFKMILSLHLILERPDTSLLEKESIFLSVMEHLLQKYADVKPQSSTLKPSGKHIKKVKEYLDQNYEEDISLEMLSELTEISPFYLLRLFKKEVGSTPHIYLTQRRINKAKQFLSSGDSLSDVAYKTGFADQSHFTNRFKNIVGITPGQYMNKNN